MAKKKTKEWLLHLLYVCLTITLSVSIGLCSMAFVSGIPTEQIKKNIGKSATLYDNPVSDRRVSSSLLGESIVDVCTDMLMLSDCQYENSDVSAWNQAINFWNEKYNDEEQESVEGIQTTIDHNVQYEEMKDWSIIMQRSSLLYPLAKNGYIEDSRTSDRAMELGENLAPYITTVSYGRYWHGYLTVLKPLLLVFSPSQLYALNAVLQWALVFIVAVAIGRRTKMFVFPYVAFVACMNPFATANCFQYSNVMYTTLFTLLAMTVFDTKLKEYNLYWFVFLLTGIITNFFDFLTFPIVTLGIPLTYYIMTNKESVEETVKNIFHWGVGYAGMWAGKWVLIAVFYPENFRKIIDSIVYRSSSNSSMASYSYVKSAKIDYVDVLSNNILFSSKLSGYAIAIVFAFFLLAVFHKQINKDKVVPYLFAIALPFLWMAVLKNHSYSHAYFVSHILCIVPTVLIAYTSSLAPLLKSKT